MSKWLSLVLSLILTTVSLTILSAQPAQAALSPRAQFMDVASSADGNSIVAITNGNVWTSTDQGLNWEDRSTGNAVIPVSIDRPWRAVASSSDGTKLFAATAGGSDAGRGRIYSSSDAGATWVSSYFAATGDSWVSIATSSTGGQIVAVTFAGKIIRSSDFGATWTVVANVLIGNGFDVASSDDGAKFSIGSSLGVFLSADSGASWSKGYPTTGNIEVRSIHSSSDGSKLVGATSAPSATNQIIRSTDSGATWTVGAVVASSQHFAKIAGSSDGVKLVASHGGSPPNYGNLSASVYTSADSGVTWTKVSSLANGGAYNLASSVDGSKLVAASEGSGCIWTSADSGATWSDRCLPTAPGIPGAPTAAAGNASATVTVAAPSSGGPVATYAVVASPGGATCTVTSTATSCTVSGLTNGTAYTFTSSATNATATSAASANSNAVTPFLPAPGTPGKPNVYPKNQSVNVGVVAPSSGGPVATYTVVASPGGATCTVNPDAQFPSNIVYCTVSGLANGTAYTFSVAASNATGTSAASVNSDSVTPIDVPSIPGVPTAVPANASVTVTVVPGSGGGVAATYRVSAHLAATSGIFSVASCTITPPASSCIVSGLTNGTPYFFKSYAVNANAESQFSAFSASATPTASVAAPPSASLSQESTVTYYSLVFDANGGAGSTQAISNHSKTALPANQLMRPGFVFMGWNTKVDGTGVAYADQATYAFNSSATLFAQWSAIKVEPQASRYVSTFAGNRAVLTPRMKSNIASWVKTLPENAAITCQGSTAGNKVTAFDKRLASNRAKNVCAQAAKFRSDLTYTINLRPASSMKTSARHTLLIHN